MKSLSTKHKLCLIIAGFLNGLFGAGGGMLTVPVLRKMGINEKKAHAMCVAVILPICVLSAVIYITSGKVTFNDALPYLPWTLLGSIIGSIILPKCKTKTIRLIFSSLILFAAGRMIFS